MTNDIKQVSEIGLNIKSDIKECPYCHTKIAGYKTYEKDAIHIEAPVYNCDCIERKKIEFNNDQYNKVITNLLKESRIDAEFMDNDFQVYRKNLIPYYKDLDWIIQGKQLLWYGDPGNHKTGQATAIMKHAIKERKLKCLYYRATEIPYQTDYIKIERCDLLVIDNFAKDNFENSRGSLFDILDKRIHNYKSNILIMNNNTKFIEQIFTMPMASRIKGFIQIMVDGDDLRGKKIYGKEENVG